MGALTTIFLGRSYGCVSANPAPRIFDSRYHIGWAIFFFKLCSPESRIDAFKVDPNLATLLERNIRDDELAGANVHCCALAGACGEIDFYANPALPLSGSLQAGCWGAKGVRVPARPLSEWIGDGVDFLKMDIEGAKSEGVAEPLRGRDTPESARGRDRNHQDPNPTDGWSSLARFLDFWERVEFAHELTADGDEVTGQPFQCMLIRFRRRKRIGWAEEKQGRGAKTGTQTR